MGLERTEIAAQIRDDINRGVYSEGTKLPSYRQLAQGLGAAPNTVGEAVRMLASEGLVRIKPRGRVVVCSTEDAAPSAEDNAELVRTELEEVQSELRGLRTQLNALDRRVSDLRTKLDE